MLNYERLVDGIFLVRTNSSLGEQCNGILIKNIENSGNILIDCNFNYRELQELCDSLNNNIESYFVSHIHLDHVSNINFYEDNGYKVRCPNPEDRYLKDMNIFMKENGMVDCGVDNIFRNIVYQKLSFKNLKNISAFKPGSTFYYGNISIETLHIPGHSPGHTAYLIRDKTKKRRNVLFVSDIGVEKSGPWYGLKHCSLKDYRDSIKKLEDIYVNEDIVLTSAHGVTYFTKQQQIFKNVLKRIEVNEAKVLAIFNSEKPKALKEIILKGVYYSVNHIKRLPSDMKKIHFFWEWYIILHHIIELIEKGVLKSIDSDHKIFVLK
ncbi:MAG: MBL fold metallo-hydrolase [Promethearchaeota archaeon]|jgi:glyoxylase-like metal-dependent hydrolase (beta-lactamase superfamily II)